MTREIKHRGVFTASPEKVFEALMDGKRHAAFTGAPAKISRKIGGAIRCYGDYIEGFNLAVEKPGLIVQAWRSEGWPKETWSIVVFKLSKGPRGGTILKFNQVGVPANDFLEKNRGWRTHYWEPLKRYLDKPARLD